MSQNQRHNLCPSQPQPRSLGAVLGPSSRISKVTAALLLTGLAASAAWGQSGNQSDVTGVDVVGTGTGALQNQSDITGVDVVETGTGALQNQSDVTGVDVVETGTGVLQNQVETATSVFQPAPSRDSSAPSEAVEPDEQPLSEFVPDQKLLAQILVNSAIPASSVVSVQSQAITTNTAPLLQQIGITLEGQEPSADQIAAALQQLFAITGNNAHYIQSTLTEDAQLVTTRLGPNPNTRLSRSGPSLPPAAPSAAMLPTLLQSRPVLSWGDRLLPSLLKDSLLKNSPEAPTLLSQTTRRDQDQFASRYVTTGLNQNALYRLFQIFKERSQSLSSFDLGLNQKLYDILIRPMEADLEAAGVDTLVVALDSRLRGIPLSALHDGEQFLGEKYALAIVPSFGLTDISYFDVRETSVLAMGASEFETQLPLPSVPLEIDQILGGGFKGIALEGQNFTVNNFTNTVRMFQINQQSLGIIHLATHGEFQSGDYNKSYIQFDDRRVSLVEFRQLAVELGWDVLANAPELLVLSACRTALGDEAAELGFAGLAVASGAKTALASLWQVSDVGTLALMSEFYDAMEVNPLKSQALQMARLRLLEGETYLRGGRLYLSSGQVLDLPPQLANLPDQDFRHPFYWSAFTLIGNWN
ncbi:MAG: CHAT domain-containing protein [Prochlorothrix sp.]|nr:CHAT domain-containing protein [Prochlorothrix sp.]